MQKSEGESTSEISSICKINSQIFLILILLFLGANLILSVAAKGKKSKDLMKFKKDVSNSAIIIIKYFHNSRK